MSQDIFSKEKKAEINYTMNNYTVKCLKVIFLVILIIWGLNLLNIFVINQRIMATGFIMACLVIMFTILMTKFLDLRKEWVKYFLITCVTIVITILGIYLTYHTLLLYALPMMIAAQYTDRKMLIYTYVLTVLGIFCGAMGGFFWGLCDANMLFLTTESTEYYLNKASKSGSSGIIVGKKSPNSFIYADLVTFAFRLGSGMTKSEHTRYIISIIFC
ncbi:MAG: hypothetical protein UH963_04190, partial [Agathobacter sp.]|nr:hypothetical protein [Agathobacter sp.]